jgi:hypothetical protein
LRTEWDIGWNLPGPAKYQYFKPGIPPIATLRLGDSIDSESMKSWIRREVLLYNVYNVESSLDPDSLSFPEGAAAYARHLKRERNAALVAYVKSQARAEGSYRSFICTFDFEKTYGIDYIECHHTIPVSAMKPETKPDRKIASYSAPIVTVRFTSTPDAYRSPSFSRFCSIKLRLLAFRRSPDRSDLR